MSNEILPETNHLEDMSKDSMRLAADIKELQEILEFRKPEMERIEEWDYSDACSEEAESYPVIEGDSPIRSASEVSSHYGEEDRTDQETNYVTHATLSFGPNG
jgi:thymidylate synthase ThyX